MRLREYFRAHRLQFAIESLIALVIAIVVLWAVIDTLHVMPPRTVTMVR